ncbi:MAG: SDR family NAD(P)-dependent oxidoreductase [Nevskiales bacterium]
MNQAFNERYGPWALITGAANGLGAEFARQLAARGFKLLLLDVEAEALATLSKQLQQTGCQVETIVSDLSRADFMAEILPACEGKSVGLLINNAGISPVGEFLQQTQATHQRSIAINITAAAVLAHHFGQAMAASRCGGMIFLSSMSALQGTRLVANYAATKAYNMILAEGLWQELQDQGIDVLAVLPGQIRTPGFIATGVRLEKAQGPVMEVAPTVREALDSLGKRPRHIPGRLNRCIAVLMQYLMPRKTAIRLVAQSMQKLYPDSATNLSKR